MLHCGSFLIGSTWGSSSPCRTPARLLSPCRHLAEGFAYAGHQGRLPCSGSNFAAQAAASRALQAAQQQQQVVVVGGGAAGLTAAYFAAQQGAKVLVLERTREAGKKILMSGGTRCNVLPLEVDISRDFFTDSSKSALRAVFAGWSLEQCKDWLTGDVGLPMVLEQETSKWFPASNSAREVRDRLVEACRDVGVTFRYNASLEGLQQQQQPSPSEQQQQQEEQQEPSSQASEAHHPQDNEPQPKWLLTLASGQQVAADHLVLATGGLSFPAVGTDGTGHRLLQRLGLTVRPPYPALTPLKGKHPGGQQLAGLTLSGVVLEAFQQQQQQQQGSSSSSSKKKAKKPVAVAQRGGFLFTHRGFSGPAVLDVSHVAVRGLRANNNNSTSTSSSSSSSSGNGRDHHAAAAGAQPPGVTTAPPEKQQAGGAASLRVNWLGLSRQYWEQQLLLQTAPPPPAPPQQPQQQQQQRRGQRAPTPPAGGGGGTSSSSSGRLQVTTLLHRAGLPERLAAALVAEAGAEEGRTLAQLKRSEREALLAALVAWELPLTGDEGYKKAEVTGGGVPLELVDSRTLEVRGLPGLFLCGEVLDVWGRIGGFNFFWAWVSGRAAGLGAAAAAATAAATAAGADSSRSVKGR